MDLWALPGEKVNGDLLRLFLRLEVIFVESWRLGLRTRFPFTTFDVAVVQWYNILTNTTVVYRIVVHLSRTLNLPVEPSKIFLEVKTPASFIEKSCLFTTTAALLDGRLVTAIPLKKIVRNVDLSPINLGQKCTNLLVLPANAAPGRKISCPSREKIWCIALNYVVSASSRPPDGARLQLVIMT